MHSSIFCGIRQSDVKALQIDLALPLN